MATRSVPKSTRAPARARKVDDDGLRLLREARKAPALFTHEEMYKLESAIGKDSDGIWRRVALAVVAQPGKKFLEGVAANRESAVAFAEAVGPLRDYLGRLGQLTEVIGAAQMRIVVALAQREDMDSLFQEARS